MWRRVGRARYAALAAVGVLALHGCASEPVAARIDGDAVASVGMVQRLAEEELAAEEAELSETLPEVDAEMIEVMAADGSTADERAASLLGQLILTDLVHRELRSRGRRIDAADVAGARAAIDDEVGDHVGGDGPLSDRYVAVRVEFETATRAAERVGVPLDVIADDVDVWVAPEVGSWDPERGVVAPSA